MRRSGFVSLTTVMQFLVAIFICLTAQSVLASNIDDFVTTWKTNNTGISSATSIAVPMVGGPYDVDWNNDETFDEFVLTGPVTHDYGVIGTKTIRIRGAYDSIQFNDGGDKEKILSIDQWGTTSWTSMNAAFFGAVNLRVPAVDIPDFSGVTDLSRMFTEASSANPDTSGWDTSAATTMRSMFYGATSADPETSGWDTSAVTTMYAMFANADSANPDTSEWDTSSVTNMEGMFYGANAANPDTSGWDTSMVTTMRNMFANTSSADPVTSGWDTSAVTSMSLMFQGATLANPDTSGWDTGAVVSMLSMFYGATSANPDTSSWNTTALVNMSYMFKNATVANPDTSGWNTVALNEARSMFTNATSFDRNIGSWDVTLLVAAENMFEGVTLSTANYESLLIGWSAQTLRKRVVFSGGDSTYCSAPAIAARANMIISDDWLITDGGSCPLTDPILAPDLTPTTDNGISNSDNITSISTPSFYVECTDIGNTITLFTDNPAANTIVDTYECAIVGTNNFKVATAITVGGHQITYTEQNDLGTSGHSPLLMVTIIPSALDDHFVTTWKTDNYGGLTNDTSIMVPMTGGNYYVDWDNDGIFDEFGLNGSVIHDFEVAGTYTIRIHGAFDSIRFDNSREIWKILSVDQWGTQTWATMERSFSGAANLEISAIDTPDFSDVTSMRGMFYRTPANPDTSDWDTSKVTDMSTMFYDTTANPNTSGLDTGAVTSMNAMFFGADSANPNTSGWDTSKVTDMSSMFSGAFSANPDTSGWNTAAVTSMRAMFQQAGSANPDTSGWDTSKVTDMSWMFYGADSASPDTSGWNTAAVTNMSGMFYSAYSASPDTSGWDTTAVTGMSVMFHAAISANPNTSNWDTSSVTDMTGMFWGAYLANPDVSGWDTSAVTSMMDMFDSCHSFDQDIGSWDVTSLTNANGMLDRITLSRENYESLLIGWNAQNLQAGVIFVGGNSVYCSAKAAAARANMISSYSWVIVDGGQVCPPPPPDSPSIPPDLTPESDTGLSDNDNFTTDNRPDFFVDCTAADNIISLYSDNPVAITWIGSHICIGEGIEIASVSIALAAGVHNITYTDKNDTGESGHSPLLAITVDVIFADGFE